MLLKETCLEQRFTCSGHRHEKYLTKNDDTNNNANNDNTSHNSRSHMFNNDYKIINVKTTWHVKFSALNFNCKFHDTLETPDCLSVIQ